MCPKTISTMSQPNKDKSTKQQLSNFSIEHILNHAGIVTKANETSRKPYDETATNRADESCELSWLQYTRFCPPKLLRQRRSSHTRQPIKRQLGRHPRIPFTNTQISILEAQFKETPYLSSAQVSHLSQLLELADIRIKIWFQNRRARERREQNQISNTKSDTGTRVTMSQHSSPIPEIFQQQNEQKVAFVNVNKIDFNC